jgi:signal transduction histidine kinase
VVASVVQEEPPGLDEVMDILDEASQARRTSRALEQKSRQLEEATAGLRAANERLQELDRLKDDFMATVTHELRTPLTSIRSFSEILLEDPAIQEAQRTLFLSIIVKETERLTRLINQMLDMAKIESGQAEWRASEVDLREVIAEAAEATGQLFSEAKVGLRLALGEALPRVRADRDRLMQVLINLLSNAVKFCETGRGEVEIRLAVAGGEARIDVSDNGPGIPRHLQETIFEKFRQGGDSATGKPRGTGLGLPISRRIVEHFGGRLWVESQPGHGATFSFVLPVEPEPRAPGTGVAAPAGSRGTPWPAES